MSSPLTQTDATRKRPRNNRPDTRAAYPRKRAAQACLTCRRRRTKCDNERPACTACLRVGTECVYQEGDKSTFDSASLEILGRLDQLEKLIKAAHPETSKHTDSHPGVSPVPSLEYLKSSEADRALSSEHCPINIETILEWPALQVPDLGQRQGLKSLLQAGSPRTESQPLLSSDVDANDARSMLRAFLDNFHIYNPVLKVAAVEEYIKYTVFNGLGWDAKSCLLLLIYALGTIATEDDTPARETSLISRQTARFRRADAFFIAAQKRMGLLLCNSGIIEAQVFFLAGVYLMTTIRPVEAWKMFVQALACCQAFNLTPGDPREEEESRLHKSIYWTWFKSELELRLEMDIAKTSAWNLQYPAFFPEPPKNLQSQGEPSWYFYLAEIALRRLGNRVLIYACQAKPEGIPIASRVSTVTEFEQQADSWSKSLPAALSLESPPRLGRESSDDGDHAALRFILNGHLLDCYEMMYWPFVAEAIEGNVHDGPGSQPQLFVRKGLEICVRRIEENQTGFWHRHHGTWLMLRSCTRSALVLIAAARSGLSSMLPEEWEMSVAKVMGLLRYWRDEAGDAADKLEILESLIGYNPQ